VIARGRELHDDPSTRALILEAHARLALARHDDAAALRDLLAVGEVAGETTQYLPVTFSWRSLAAIAAHRLGEQDRARGWIAEELEASTTHGAQVRGCALRAGGIVYGGDGGLELLQESVEQLERSSCALEHAHSLLALGAALRRSGQHVRARSHLRRALDLAADFGAVPLAQQARDELRASGARPRRERTQGWGALTPSEQRIATLAAAGRSTPEISRELVVSRKTVEWHLAHVFDKLGVRSRLQLRDAWSQSGRSDSSSATLGTP
jgi:DNA-binding CsgD family transcriptional regulator